MKRFSPYFLSLTFIIIFAACSQSLQNLHLVKQQIIEYHESGQFDKETNKVINEAIKKFSKVTITHTSAVVFDVDETALSNYEHIVEHDFGYIPPLWNKWVLEARAPAIEPVLTLYNYLADKDVKFIFLTGRSFDQHDATVYNLKNVGFTTFDTLITRGENERKLSALEFKSKKRLDLTEKGYDIIGSVGDQWSDLEGPYSGIQVKIPNYLYLIK